VILAEEGLDWYSWDNERKSFRGREETYIERGGVEEEHSNKEAKKTTPND